MPRIQPKSDQHSAATVDVKKLFRERLISRFKATDFVRVINPDNEDFEWSYLPSSKEDLQMSSDGMHRYAQREDPEYYLLSPGESEVIIGENAYIMIEALFKKMVAKKLYMDHGDFKPGQPARNFNFSDALAQEQLIDKIYLGKEQPNFGTSNVEATNDTPATKDSGTARPKSTRA